MIDTIKSINKPLQGSLKPVEPKVEEEDTANTIRLVFGTMEKDGTIRDATEEEILHFNELALSDLQRKELDSKSKYAPTITAQRGFSNGEHISHGFFTKLAI